MKLNPETIARASSRRPWRTLGVWLVLIAAMGAVTSALLAGVLNQDIAFTNSPESVRAQNILDEEFHTTRSADTEFFIVHSDSLAVSDAQYEGFVKQLQADVARLDGTILAGPPLSYYDVVQQSPDQAAGWVSQDQHYTLVLASLKDVDDATIAKLRT